MLYLITVKQDFFECWGGGEVTDSCKPVKLRLFLVLLNYPLCAKNGRESGASTQVSKIARQEHQHCTTKHTYFVFVVDVVVFVPGTVLILMLLCLFLFMLLLMFLLFLSLLLLLFMSILQCLFCSCCCFDVFSFCYSCCCFDVDVITVIIHIVLSNRSYKCARVLCLQ